MLDNFSILTISPFVGVLNEATKSIAKCFKKDINRYIPIFSLVYGVILGIAGYYIPDLNFGHNLVEAIFAGLVGGGAATGIHQTFHQLSSKSDGAETAPSDDNDDDYNNDEDVQQDNNTSDTISDDTGDIQDDDSCTEPDETL